MTTAFNVFWGGARVMMQSGGSIVLCSSAAARIGLANHEAIAAAKAGDWLDAGRGGHLRPP
ncbi:MAG: hypothetical protein ACKVP5_06750 [Aestuariivirga sp.]